MDLLLRVHFKRAGLAFNARCLLTALLHHVLTATGAALPVVVVGVHLDNVDVDDLLRLLLIVVTCAISARLPKPAFFRVRVRLIVFVL